MAAYSDIVIKDGVLIKYYSTAEDVRIPEGVTAVGESAFCNYRGQEFVTNVILPEGVTSIGDSAFYKGKVLKSVVLPKGLKSIGDRAFCQCRELRDPVFPNGLESIGESAFSSCWGLRRLKFPETLKSIGKSAFSGCIFLDAAVFPESLTSLGDSAFSGTGLTSVTIPAGVTDIGFHPFSGCRELTDISVSEQNPVYKSRDNVIFSRDGSTLAVCGWKTGSYEIPAGVTEIRGGAFFGCSELTSVTIPEGVTSIGDSAFSGCTGLVSVKLPKSLKSIGKYAFSGSENLMSAVIPDSVTEIGSYAFNRCTRLASVKLPEGITGIADNTFFSCSSLTDITLPANVATIGKNAFWACESLTEITFPAGLKNIDAWAFFECKGLASVTVPAGTEKIGFSAFCGCTGLTDISIPADVKEIGAHAFSECTGLKSVTVPDAANVVSVFEKCSSLKEYRIPPESKIRKAVDGVVFSKDGKQLIAYPPARECERYDIPDTVTEVCHKAFAGACAKLIFVPVGVETFGETTAKDDGETVSYVAHSNPAFMEILDKPVYLGPPEDLPRSQRGRAVQGFSYALKAGMPEIEPWKESYFAHLRQERETYEKMSWNNEDLISVLMEFRILNPETAGHMLRKFSAAGRNELAEALQSYLDSF